MGPRNHLLDGGAHWRHLANMMEPFILFLPLLAAMLLLLIDTSLLIICLVLLYITLRQEGREGGKGKRNGRRL